LVLAGGGAEGAVGDVQSWSYRLYRRLFDPVASSTAPVRLVVLARDDGTDPGWLPSYFVWLGSTRGLNVVASHLSVGSDVEANSPAHLAPLLAANLVFIKGGDQGFYYRTWRNSLLTQRLRQIHAQGGGIGGTSAGAMALAEFCFCGGRDLIAEDVLADAHTPLMNDAVQTSASGIRSDFLPFLGDAIVDTHFTERGRLGRLLGILAKSAADFGRHQLLAIGLEAKTGIVVYADAIEVLGVGEVSILQPTGASEFRRVPGAPLTYTALRLDRLVEGYGFNLSTQRPVVPAGTPVPAPFVPGPNNAGALAMLGSQASTRQAFSMVASIFPSDYALTASLAGVQLRQAIGFEDAGAPASRMDKHEALFHALHDLNHHLGILLFRGTQISRTAEAPDVLQFSGEAGFARRSAIVISSAKAEHESLSPYPSNWATSGGAMRAAAITGLRVDVLADSTGTGISYNSKNQALLGGDRIFKSRMSFE